MSHLLSLSELFWLAGQQAAHGLEEAEERVAELLTELKSSQSDGKRLEDALAFHLLIIHHQQSDLSTATEASERCLSLCTSGSEAC